jgi:hypothetical protein
MQIALRQLNFALRVQKKLFQSLLQRRQKIVDAMGRHCVAPHIIAFIPVSLSYEQI